MEIYVRYKSFIKNNKMIEIVLKNLNGEKNFK